MDHAKSILLAGGVIVLSGALSPWPRAALGAQTATPAGATAVLDYETFKTKVQPILTAPRQGNARCAACHSRAGGNAFLEPLTPGSVAYTDEQSRRNFERVSRLVVPGDPLKSLLLTNPLATDAGGSHWHGGGKHWLSQENAEWQTLAGWVRTRPAGTASVPASASPPVSASAPASASSRPGLSLEVFKTKVQPILTSPRKGNARCSACHSRAGGNAYLEPLPPGSTTYTDEQSQRNFDRVSRLVVPGDPLKSVLLVNPLATDAGGSHWHGGGKHWQSQDHPEWQTLAAWVRGN
jgi:mono/diheme cytochrome c family protein